ncbi:ABC transporter ATP-binding protein [Thermodesulforhabdus norvegica]|uniref:Lipoprotein-releasing system ATP-binding protein n=1 Tax=Thermodesulforhabdus norvegica TaxID=39841 RepID=A0A1I4UPS2_9BACT|nr:ABC transporter ATP-binding protein [Thermodesulforhabdus norvegica]SFM90999.1 lipoprotein-releasing system ATP-binding protein [Thermodesulforhabdus norvegica]
MSKERDAMPLIHGVKLTKVFGEGWRRVEVFRDLDIVVCQGERLGIVGASGVGKSTLLHVLATLDRPTSGKVFFRGTDVYLLGDEERARFRNKHIGFVFQFHYLLPDFNALENVMMPGIVAGLPSGMLRRRASEWLERVGLSERMYHRVGELSGGEQQRVALARALIMEPEIVFADEPTGNLDSATSRMIHQMLIKLNEDTGVTLVVVTHNEELASMMHRCLKLSDGSLKPVEKIGAGLSDLRRDEALSGHM